MKLGRLLLRLVVGGYFFGHGTQKLFGWFGGHGLEGTAGILRIARPAARQAPRARRRRRRGRRRRGAPARRGHPARQLGPDRDDDHRDQPRAHQERSVGHRPGLRVQPRADRRGAWRWPRPVPAARRSTRRSASRSRAQVGRCWRCCSARSAPPRRTVAAEPAPEPEPADASRLPTPAADAGAAASDLTLSSRRRAPRRRSQPGGYRGLSASTWYTDAQPVKKPCRAARR